jgi:TIR domain
MTRKGLPRKGSRCAASCSASASCAKVGPTSAPPPDAVAAGSEASSRAANCAALTQVRGANLRTMRYRAIIGHMARCTAPIDGHRTSSGRAKCPACGGRGGGYGYRSYSPPSYYSTGVSGSARSSGRAGSSSSGSSARPRWSPAGSTVIYTPVEVRALTPFRESFEKRGPYRDRRDFFLCHAWDDRRGPAKDLHDHLELVGVSVWFSEKDIPLGTPFLREIDKGLAKSKIGIVLVTPALLERLKAEVGSIADKELSALLASDQLIPVVHNTTYEALRDVSPMLASRNGLNTAENTMANVAAKLAELVTLPA